jgi:purine nucleoside permease
VDEQMTVRQLAERFGVQRAALYKAIQRRTEAGDPPPAPVHTDPASGTRYWDPTAFGAWLAAGRLPGRPRKT